MNKHIDELIKKFKAMPGSDACLIVADQLEELGDPNSEILRRSRLEDTDFEKNGSSGSGRGAGDGEGNGSGYGWGSGKGDTYGDGRGCGSNHANGNGSGSGSGSWNENCTETREFAESRLPSPRRRTR